jgi:cytoplasmic FMR1 interacting protein
MFYFFYDSSIVSVLHLFFPLTVLSHLIQSYLEDSITNPSKKQEMLGDSVAWAGCTIMYLLGQQLHFELFDFSYQFLNVAEIENTTVSLYQSADRSKSPNIFQVRSSGLK